MRSFLGLFILLLVVRSAGAFTVEVEADSEEVPLFGAFTGAVVIANETSSEIAIAAPSMMLGALRYEVKGPAGIIRVGASDCALVAQSPVLTLGAGGRIRVPVFLMKSDSVYLFGNRGPVSVRCVVAGPRGSDGKSEERASQWLDLSVTDDALSDEWRVYFDEVMDAKYPFELSIHSASNSSFARFVGSRYFRSHVMYQGISIYELGDKHAPDIIASYVTGNQQFMAGDKSAARMWSAFAGGNYCLDSRACSDGSYYLCR